MKEKGKERNIERSREERESRVLPALGQAGWLKGRAADSKSRVAHCWRACMGLSFHTTPAKSIVSGEGKKRKKRAH